MRLHALSIVAALTLASAPASAEDPATLAASLARLRGEVETLSTAIDTQKADQQARMRSLATQKAELEIQLKREELRLKELGKHHAAHRRRVEAQNQRRAGLAPAVSALTMTLERALDDTLPFQLEERLKEPKALLERLEDQRIDVDTAIAQLWEQVEDELRLGRESGLYTQTLVIDGRPHLVEVARVGMVMLFFRTQDGRYGLLRRQGDAWDTVVLANKARWAPVAALFDAFKKQIRTGFFVLPNALPGGAR